MSACAQSCPQQSSTGPSVPSATQTLTGKLVYHDGLRQWYELKLDKARCEAQSIELVRGEKSWTPLEVLRGCQVSSRGTIRIPLTGYYSLALYQDVTDVEATGTCIQQKQLPDYSGFKPDKAIRRYRVMMLIDYEPGDHPIDFQVTSAGRRLRPWQAYASYLLTGGFALYGECGAGFMANQAFGTVKAKPWTLDGEALFDPETAAAAGEKHLRLGYTCVRQSTTQ